MDINMIIEAGINVLLAVAAASGWIKRKKDVEQLTKVMDKSDTPNERFKQIAVEIGVAAARKILNKTLK